VEPVRVSSQGLPEGCAESLPKSVSEGCTTGLPQGLLPRALSSACAAGLPESLSPPLLLDEALILRILRLFGGAEQTRGPSPRVFLFVDRAGREPQPLPWRCHKLEVGSRRESHGSVTMAPHHALGYRVGGLAHSESERVGIQPESGQESARLLAPVLA
jgi:hypothetical protein